MVFSFVRLKKWWRAIFPDSDLPLTSFGNFHLLFGIMQRVPQAEISFSPFQYECQVLQRTDFFPQTAPNWSMERILKKLSGFGHQWYRHQELLVLFNLSRSTALCPDVLAGISPYLSFDQTIRGFSLNILPLLRQTHTKINLVEPIT